MVYESDFYTSRRPYRPSSYSVTRRSQVDWEKVPFVPRPSLIADPITAFGKREKIAPRQLSILTPEGRASIKPCQKILSQPVKPYVSARDITREKVLTAVRKQDLILEAGGDISALTDRQHMDVLLHKLHRTTNAHEPKTRVFYSNYASY